MLVELVAISLAALVAGLIATAASGWGARERRRARDFCTACGRTFVQRQPTCDCD